MDSEQDLKAEREKMLQGVDLEGLVRNDAERKRELLRAPVGAAERVAQEAYLEDIGARANARLDYSTDYHRQLAMAARDRDEYTKSIQFLESLSPEEYPDWDDAAAARTAKAIEHARINLACAYFTLGEFDLAAKTYPLTDEARVKYLEYAVAELLPDDATCACPKVETAEEVTPEGQRVTVDNHTETIEGKFPNTRRNTSVFAIRCVKCGILNVRPTVPEGAMRDYMATRVPDASWQFLKSVDPSCCEPAGDRTLAERYEQFYRDHPEIPKPYTGEGDA